MVGDTWSIANQLRKPLFSITTSHKEGGTFSLARETSPKSVFSIFNLWSSIFPTSPKMFIWAIFPWGTRRMLIIIVLPWRRQTYKQNKPFIPENNKVDLRCHLERFTAASSLNTVLRSKSRAHQQCCRRRQTYTARTSKIKHGYHKFKRPHRCYTKFNRGQIDVDSGARNGGARCVFDGFIITPCSFGMTGGPRSIGKAWVLGSSGQSYLVEGSKLWMTFYVEWARGISTVDIMTETIVPR